MNRTTNPIILAIDLGKYKSVPPGATAVSPNPF